MRTKARKKWLCSKCGYRNEHRTSSRKCQNPECGELTKRRPPKRKHRATLAEDSYEVYELLSVTIHGGEAGACGVCGKPPSERRKNDRDHCHKTGRPRGLACPGDYGCNLMMLPWIDAATAYKIAEAKTGKERVRWTQIGDYLSRVDRYYEVYAT